MGLLAAIAQPNPYPWTRAIGIGMVITIVPLAWWTLLWALGIRAPVPVVVDIPVPLAIAAAVVIAPVVETAFVALAHWLIVTLLGAPTPAFVAVVGLGALAAHWPLSVVRSPVIGAIFLVFALQYAGWAAVRGRWIAFGGTALAHAVYNGIALAMAPLWAILLRPA